VPIIEFPGAGGCDELFDVKVTLDKETAHPNRTGHHIQWIALYSHQDWAKFTCYLARF
jgi:superoxide reductase